MHLKKIEIDNFKSLVDFQIEFERFNCIVGLNGSGKSTLLQALDLISQMMKGDISNWLQKRNWTSKDLHSKLTKTKNISFKLYLEENKKNYTYEAVFNPSKLKCTSELVFIGGKQIVKIENSKLTMDEQIFEIIQDYEGSLLSSIKESKFEEDLLKLKNFIKDITSLDLLSPQALRQKSRNDGKELGLSGEHLTTFLYALEEEKKDKLLEQIKKCYPNILSFELTRSRNGWKKLEVIENFEGSKITTEARHLNDGFLRLIALLAQLFTSKDFLLFDEIENGINPELIEFLINSLIESSHQVLITTHSPLILNYIDDETAKNSIKYIYKTKDGFTRVINFFNIPSMAKKLKVMGAGEVYADTNLSQLYDEIVDLEFKK
ncbi:AAA family ATPase [Arcobacter vandammei]|uniref:AAA family ATPase n=1 Tax=Arcobacter vandammei TaxID=2782243 RepID=UPI0018DF206E